MVSITRVVRAISFLVQVFDFALTMPAKNDDLPFFFLRAW